MTTPMGLAATRLIAWLSIALLTACATTEKATPPTSVNAPSLAPSMLEGHGLALLTPASAPAQSENRQALALAFASVFSKLRPEVRLVPLSQTVGAVNRAGLTRQYLKLYEIYAATGIMDRDTLSKLRGVCGARFFALLQLAELSRIMPSEVATSPLSPGANGGIRLRLFVQIWDSTDGTVAWEGVSEVRTAAATGSDDTFSAAAERAARDLVFRMP